MGPIALYGCKAWTFKDVYLDNIQEFHTFIGKRVQCLSPKTSNVVSFFGVWMSKVEMLIRTRKIRLNRYIMVMDQKIFHA